MNLAKAAVLAGSVLILAAAFGCENVEAADIEIGEVSLERVYREYHGMQELEATMQELQMDMHQAQEAGDQERMMELQQEFRREQEEFEREFDSALQEAARAVSEEKGIDMVVAEVINETPGADVREVTDEIIAEINRDAPEPAKPDAPMLPERPEEQPEPVTVP